ncbi:MAG TPA: hypothetical protein VFF68_09970 [Anaerolineaceae bacterium]|nr:hypothetical protein [Anaerolineaceae bacterium]
MKPFSPRLARLVELESGIAYRSPPAPGVDEFSYRPGALPVLLSAPHGAAHVREGRFKQEDEYTAGLGLLLAELTGAHVLYSHNQSATDPNWHRDTPYKHRLREILARGQIRCVVDLHGASPRHDFGLAVGTMRGRSLPHLHEPLLAALRRSGFSEGGDDLLRLDLDHRFTGSGGTRQETVTRFVWESLGVPAVQLEVNARLRIVTRLLKTARAAPFQGDHPRIEHLIDTLAGLVAELADHHPQG